MSKLDRTSASPDSSSDLQPSNAPGRGTLTSRLTPRAQQTIVFRVESAEAAAVFADRFGQRDDNGVAADADVAIDRAASSSSTGLPSDVRSQFEGSTGADLSGVRVHTGSESAQAASAVGAHAYTVGQDIHFAEGKYAPADPFGLHLLAHEVAHTVQQQGGAPSTQYKLEVSAPGDAHELEADRAADAMVRGAQTEITSAGGASRKIARKTGDDAWWKLVMVQYAAFLKANGGDQTKALAQLKVQLGGAYPGDEAVLARAGGAKPAGAPADAPADAPAADGGTCDPANQKSDANAPAPAADDGGQCVDPNAGGPAKNDNAPAGEGGEKKEGEGAKKEGEGGEKKEEGATPGVEVTPLKVGGIELGLKVGAEGVEIGVSKVIELRVPPVYICPGVFLSFEPKVSLSGKVKYTKEGGWDGALGLGFEFGAYINGGAPWARFYAGGKLNLDLSPHIGKNGFGEISGDLSGALLIGAELKVPFSQGAKMSDPEGWKSSGGVKFEMELAKSKFYHIVISGDGFTGTWIGPDLSSHGSALQAWKEEYQRNFSGGGAEGAPPYGAEGPAQDQDNNGAGGSHG